MKTLIVVDMQNDFIDGSLGTREAQAIVPKVKEKIKEYQERGDEIIFTRDERVIIRTKLEKPSKIKGLALI